MTRIRWLSPILVLLLFSCAASHRPGPSDPFILRVYRDHLNHLEAVRANECPMYPSCSEYSKAAITEHGWITGWMMTVDRLMRCGRDETKLSPLVRVDGKWRYYDPLTSNTFWWHDPSHPAPGP